MVRNAPEETAMPRYVIGPDVVRRLAQEQVVVATDASAVVGIQFRSTTTLRWLKTLAMRSECPFL
jgi:hypothetical protein